MKSQEKETQKKINIKIGTNVNRMYFNRSLKLWTLDTDEGGKLEKVRSQAEKS